MNTVRDPAPLNQAIEAIYSYFKGDREFTEFMKDLEDFLAVGETGQPVFTGEIGRHFDIAAELAQVMPPAPDAKYRVLVEGPALKIVLDRGFRIVAQSQEARTALGHMDGYAVTLDRSGRTAIFSGTPSGSGTQAEKLVASLNPAVLASAATLFEQEGRGEQPDRCFVRSETDTGFVSLLRDPALDVIVVTLPMPSRNRTLPAVLCESMGLSPSEAEVLELMAQGKSNIEISRERFRSIETVKSQTQAIFRKLGVASRVEAVQVVNDLVSLAALSGGPSEPVGKAAGNLAFAHDRSVWLDTERDGRTISYVQYPVGAQNAAPASSVLMFHGLLQGPELTLGLRQRLRQSGIELIGASKPGYGATDPQVPGTSFMRTSIEDARHVCERRGIERPIVLGHLFGGHAAIEYCLAYPHAVSGLILCSAYFPLQIADHLVPMGVLQKLAMSSGIASAAAHQFIALTAVAYLRYGGSHRYLATLAENSPADSEAIRDKEIYDLLRAGIRHVIGAGASAFLSDTSSSNADWSGLLSRLDLPVTVIHGETDPAVNARLARLAASHIPNARHCEIPRVGQHLLHAAPDTFLTVLNDMIAAAR